MGTRCNVQFIEKEEKVLIYKHWDGYPEGESGMIAFLKEFFAWQGITMSVQYTSANFILFGKLKSVASRNRILKKDNKPLFSVESLLDGSEDNDFLGGFGICPPDAKNIDHAFVYIVTLSNGNVTIEVKTSFDQPTIETVVIELPR